MAEINCANLETVLSNINFRSPTVRYPHSRDHTDADLEIANKWLDNIDQRYFETDFNLSDEAEEFFALAEKELGGLKPEDVPALRKAAREAIESRVFEAIGKCSTLALQPAYHAAERERLQAERERVTGTRRKKVGDIYDPKKLAKESK